MNVKRSIELNFFGLISTHYKGWMLTAEYIFLLQSHSIPYQAECTAIEKLPIRLAQNWMPKAQKGIRGQNLTDDMWGLFWNKSVKNSYLIWNYSWWNIDLIYQFIIFSKVLDSFVFWFDLDSITSQKDHLQNNSTW